MVKLSDHRDILTFQYKQIEFIGNKKRRSFKMTPWKIEINTRQLKAENKGNEEKLKKKDY